MKSPTAFGLNGRACGVDADDERLLLWVLRTELQLTGTKYGCGEGICGACTVVVSGNPEAAAVALGRLEANWWLPVTVLDPDSIFEYVVSGSAAPKEIVNRGDAVGARAGATRVFEATHQKGYVAHARPSKLRGSPRSQASPFRSRGRARRSSSTTPSIRPRW